MCTVRSVLSSVRALRASTETLDSVGARRSVVVGGVPVFSPVTANGRLEARKGMSKSFVVEGCGGPLQAASAYVISVVLEDKRGKQAG
eukprot:7324010-Pyramimonas_sp.AAC.1